MNRSRRRLLQLASFLLPGVWTAAARSDEDAWRTVVAGRAQARRLGTEFDRRGIRIDEVRSSRWCRCLDTARLAFPGTEVAALEELDSFFSDSSTREAQTGALRDYLGALPATRRAVLVTHMVNITALTGESPAMGEALVVRTGASETGQLLGRIRVDSGGSGFSYTGIGGPRAEHRCDRRHEVLEVAET